MYIGSERLWNKDLEMIPRKYLDCFIVVYEKLIFFITIGERQLGKEAILALWLFTINMHSEVSKSVLSLGYIL